MQPEREWKFETNPAWRSLANTEALGVVLMLIFAGLYTALVLVARQHTWARPGSAYSKSRRLFDGIAVAMLVVLLVGIRFLSVSLRSLSASYSEEIGYGVLALCAAVLVGLTLWTYVGSAQTTPRRLFILVFLRLLALLVAMIAAIRPSLSETEYPRIRSTLIIALDTSESMTITNEFGAMSRWDVLKNVMEKCDPILKQLEKDQEVSVHVYGFSTAFDLNAEEYKSKVDDKDVSIPQWLAGRKPDGKRTDFGGMLQKLYNQFQNERYPRGLIIVSDGANNVTNPDAFVQATKWRGIGCPIYTFLIGRTDTKSDQKDIALVGIAPDPSPVPVKADLIVKGTLNAQGLEGTNIKVRLTISSLVVSDGGKTKEWVEIRDLTRTEQFRLFKPMGNEIEIATKAPDKPGEVKVKLEIVEPPAEDRVKSNNEIETYLTVTKEGVRVLVIDRLRPELKYLRYALATGRFNFVEVIRQTDDPPPAAEARKYDILNEAYDAIILGDVSPARLRAINPEFMDNIDKLVREKGVGLLMMGGIDSFGGTPNEPGSTGWRNTPIGNLLPVELPANTGQIDESTAIAPTRDGFGQYIMKLDPVPDKNRKLWEDLGSQAYTRLGGFTVLGTPKQGATIYATARRVVNGGQELPLLVGQPLGKGRVLAFGADQTWKWVNFGGDDTPKNKDDQTPGQSLHARFWKQVVLWLAHQEEIEGNVYVHPEFRRLSVNGKNIFRMGIKDKRTVLVENAKMRYQVLLPDMAIAKRATEQAPGDLRRQVQIALTIIKEKAPTEEDIKNGLAALQQLAVERKPGETELDLLKKFCSQQNQPDEKRAKSPERGEKGEYRVTYEVKEAGEYQVVAWGEGKDPDGSDIKGDASSRFIVDPDISDEMLRPAARDDFLLGLENAANGLTPETIRRADKLPGFLEEEYIKKPLKLTTAKPKLHPDWRRNGNPWFLPVVLAIFVTILGFEWGLRRIWGMV